MGRSNHRLTQAETTFDRRVKLFENPPNRELLCCNLRGVERESLRVTTDGEISKESHPKNLGAPLSHPFITTDYSEALLEFITEPLPKIGDLLQQLEETHCYAADNLWPQETLWPCSMPCILGDDEDIPIAQYGSSNPGLMKTIYRRGLGHRYGRKMQSIAGVHFNFSVPDAVWSRLRAHESSLLTLQEYRTQGYMALVRNFRRQFWLLLYLMGASPVAHKSFVKGRMHDLEELNSEDVYLPYATTLRMGTLGYQSTAQDDLFVCYNSIETYVRTLQEAILTDYAPYSAFSSTSEKSNREQLSSAILQIENEFYSTIRPKQTTRSGETQLKALKERGVEYIEVRCVDINPFDPLGINREQIQFMELFLLGCLFADSPETNKEEYAEILANQKQVVREGRRPNLTLLNSSQSISIREWATQIFEQLEPVAVIMDELKGARDYSESLEKMKRRVATPSECPSSQILHELEANNEHFVQWALRKSNEHANWYAKHNLSEAAKDKYATISQNSVQEQAQLESHKSQHLDKYIEGYFEQYRNL